MKDGRYTVRKELSELPMNKAPLEEWMAGRMGIGKGTLTRETIRRYQLQHLQQTLSWACQYSPFYRERLSDVAAAGLQRLADITSLPFTTADQIRQEGLKMLCVSQGDISRVVTLESSGTTGPAKRLYFTPEDQEMTIQFFQHGMAALAEPGDRVLILLPGERPGSVGDLLAAALRRLGATPIPHGVVRHMPDTLAVMHREQVNVLVGIPVQVLTLARFGAALGQYSLRLKSVLLSTDHVPQAIVRELKRFWHCEVFEHYGMTELGLGGGTACSAHEGYHLHEADFYVETVHPSTGQVLPEGQQGEVVVTTLTRHGMPLIRYRTGDMSRFLPEPCPCGSILKRLERITARKSDAIRMSNGESLTLGELDEVLFSLPEVTDFTARVDNMQNAAKLTVNITAVGKVNTRTEWMCLEALSAIPAIRAACTAGLLEVAVTVTTGIVSLQPTTAKRRITELSQANG